MAKNLKLKIKNSQLASAINLGKLKKPAAPSSDGISAPEQPEEKKLKEEKVVSAEKASLIKKPAAKSVKAKEKEPVKPEAVRRIKAKSRSSFAPASEQPEEQAARPAPEELSEQHIEELTREGHDEAAVHALSPEMEAIAPELASKESTSEPLLTESAPRPSPEEESQKEKKVAAGEPAAEESEEARGKGAKIKEFRDFKPKKGMRPYEGRERQPLKAGEEEGEEAWRRRRHKSRMPLHREEALPIRPTSLKVRLPTTVKDLAGEMKLKASQLVAKLFQQGVELTLNDILSDEMMVQLLGHEFGCEITIDTTEEERIRITDKTIKEEVSSTNPELLQARAPVVAFMGHVDHGKTSLIDAIRKSNIAGGEAGAITQHIGAFRCQTAVGPITVLDTPGHEAFTTMRARGAEVTDVVVLVIAGDEGIRQQTVEAIQHAKTAGVTILVAINKCDKPNFNAENVYRQLADQELLPEAWGGSTVTVNCSAVTKQGVDQLLEMIALQADILELRANPSSRARGTVLESAMHKGMGAVATILVQNGTLRFGDSFVFQSHWGRVKTMRDEYGNVLREAGPSTPVAITGLSGLPEAGEEFVVVKDEKEARNISAARSEGHRQTQLLQKKQRPSVEHLMQQPMTTEKKILNLILRADVQGSLEALKTSLLKIKSDKVEIQIIFSGIGAISESDIELAEASKAVIIGFHTHVESHAEEIIKQLKVEVALYDIIYHAIDAVKKIMAGRLDKIAQETDTGTAEVRNVFKASQLGRIAGCMIIDGTISRNNKIRLMRGGEQVWKGNIASLRRVKEDVKEVKKGFECGILLENSPDVQEGDILQAYEITYLTQEL